MRPGWFGTSTVRVRGRPSVGQAGRVAVVVALVVTVLLGLVGLRIDTGPSSFLPASDDALAAADRSARAFGGDPVVVVAEAPEPGLLLDAEHLPRLLALEGELARLPDVAVVYGPATVLNQIAIASQNLLAHISGRRDAVRREAEVPTASEEDRVAAGDAAVAAFDRRYGTLLVQALPAGLPTLHNQGFVQAVLFDAGGVPRPEWRYVTPTPDAVAMLVRPRQDLDQVGTERLIESVRAAVDAAGLPVDRLTVSGAPAIATGLAEQVRREVPLLAALALGLIGLSYLLAPWRPRRRERLVPPVIAVAASACVLAAFGWLDRPVSLGVVAFLPILIGIGSDFPAYLMRGVSLRPVLVTAAASAAAFGALAVSPLPFVRDLGLALAAGVVVAAAMGLLARRWCRSSDDADPDPTGPVDVPTRAAPPGRRLPALVLASMVAVGGWVALPTLDVEARPDQLAPDLPAISEARYAESVLGSSGEVRVVLHGADVLTPEAIGWVRQAQERVVLTMGADLRVILSPSAVLGFLGADPSPEQIAAGVRFLPEYLTGAVVSPDRSQAAISLGLRLQDLQDQANLLDALEEVLPDPPPGFRTELVGLPVVAARAHTLIDGDRYLTNGLGIVVAGIVLAVGLRRRRDAASAVSAAVLATGWGLAAVWALGISLSPLTVALGSLTTATACEFTVLLANAREHRRLRYTVGVAALAAALGYAVLAASGLAVIREFGLLLAATVGLSYLAARLVVGRRGVTPVLPAEPCAVEARVEEKL